MNVSPARARLALLLLLATVLGVGLWAYRGVDASLHEIRSTGLRTLLNTQVEALDQWVLERRHEVGQIAADPDLGKAIAQLARSGKGNGEGGRIVETIRQAADNIDIAAIHVLDAKGGILASTDAEAIGQRVEPRLLTHLPTVLGGSPIFLRPYSSHGGSTPAQPGRIWVIAPCTHRGAR
ncbi:MAG: hypothetical protein M5R42_06340 [Rhodocyclaceae bacterium]|nr:hypothetical protein [Rhodocyclaceae bacterium]